MKKVMQLISVRIGWVLFVMVVMFLFCWLLNLSIGRCYALTNVTKPFNFGIRDTIKSSKFNADFDTLYNRVNQTNDSLEKKFIRFTDVKDSTFQKINTDTITGDVKFTGTPTINGDTICSGSGSSGFLTKWAGAGLQGNSLISEGTRVDTIHGKLVLYNLISGPRYDTIIANRLNIVSPGFVINGCLPWTTANFDPATKMDTSKFAYLSGTTDGSGNLHLPLPSGWSRDSAFVVGGTITAPYVELFTHFVLDHSKITISGISDSVYIDYNNTNYRYAVVKLKMQKF